MAVTGDHYVGAFEGHSLELIRNNWTKRYTLLIDGEEVASESCMLPHDITLTASFSHQGTRHEVVAKSLVDRMVFTKDSIAVDGVELTLAKTK